MNRHRCATPRRARAALPQSRPALRGWAAYVALLVAALSSPARAEAIFADAPEAQGEATPWTSLAANDAAEDFHFVIVGDRTGGARHGVFESAVDKVNLLEPAFVLSVGDLIEGGTENQAQLDAEWDEFERFAAGFEAPFFYAAGNHDMSNAVMSATWRARFGPSYYRFVYKDVLFLVLNSELFGMVRDPATPVPGPWTQAEQLAFVERTLREFPNPRWTVVLVHQPLWDYAHGRRGDWPKVEAMLGQRDYTVFAGHSHRYVKSVRQGRRFITLATTGGGSSLRGLRYGEFDHVAWVTMTAQGPRVANLLLEGIHDENVITASRRAVTRALAGTVYPFRPAAVYPLPVFGEGERFAGGAAAFEASNPGEEPLRVRFHVDPGPHLRYLGVPKPLVLAPGAAERIELPLAPRGGSAIRYRDIAPGRVSWSLTTDSGEGPVELELTFGLLPVTRLRLPSGAAPTVDGDLAEWPRSGPNGDLPFAATRQGDVAAKPTAPTDISFSFAVREAGGDLYFAAHVTDDSVVASPAGAGKAWSAVQDALVIFVDSRPEAERALNLPLFAAARGSHLTRIAVAYQTVASAARSPQSAPQAAIRAESSAAVTWRTRRTAAGYVAEARISGDFLDAQAGGRWHTVRVGVVAVDWDEGEIDNHIPWHVQGSSAVALHWQPDRFGAAPVAGSGTFVRAEE